MRAVASIVGAMVTLTRAGAFARSRHASGVAGLRSPAPIRADRFAAERELVGLDREP